MFIINTVIFSILLITVIIHIFSLLLNKTNTQTPKVFRPKHWLESSAVQLLQFSWLLALFFLFFTAVKMVTQYLHKAQSASTHRLTEKTKQNTLIMIWTNSRSMMKTNGYRTFRLKSIVHTIMFSLMIIMIITKDLHFYLNLRNHL